MAKAPFWPKTRRFASLFNKDKLSGVFKIGLAVF
jgi:hypothetical protein